MNIGPSDIIQGLRALDWIWKNGFVYENSKDVRYENFRRDVQDFDAVLRDVASALADAERRYRQRGANSALNPRDASFEQERRRLVGAFDVTLQECQDVLERHRIAPQTNAQGVLQSLIWNSGVEDRVNDLRRRLQFHSQKMLLVVNRLSLQLMTDSADRLDDILGLSEQSIVLHERTQAMLQDTYMLLAAHVQGALPISIAPRPAEPPPIPVQLAWRFQKALSINAPFALVQSGYSARELPMDEAFDALMVHFAGSADAAAGSQTPEHYVQLLKAMWLVQQLQASQDYQNARPGYYYRRAINQIEQQLLARMKDPRLLWFDVDILVALSNETYEIWPSPRAVATISQVDARPGEYEEARLDLVLQGDFTEQRIVVFRRSEHRFRIVQENIRDFNGRTEQQIPLSFDMTRDQFIPWYSLPQTSRSAHEVAISNQATGDLESYRFRSSGDLYRFQAILLGQRMVFEDTRVTFKLSDGTHGIGRFQIWQEPVAGRPSLNGLDCSSSSSSIAISPSSRIGSIAGSVAPSTVFEHADGMEGGSVPLPALVILTELQGKVAYLYVKLEQGFRIFPEHCECRNGQAGYARCKVLSLARDRLRKFPVYIQYAKSDDHGDTIISSCDISVFRIPMHPRMKQLKPKMIDNLHMTFQSPTVKDAFNLELHQRFELRDRMFKQHNDYDHTMLYGAERPERTRMSRASTGQTLTRTASLAPTVGSLQLGESFAHELPTERDPAHELPTERDPAPSRPGARPNEATFSNPRLSRTSTDMTIRPAAQNGQRVQGSHNARNQHHDNTNYSSKPFATSSGIRNLFRSSRF